MQENIRLVAVDVDGTLFNSSHELTPRTEAALRQLMAQEILVVFATGKTRRSTESVIQQLGLQTPGVYSQGLIITNGDGSVQHETRLDPALVSQIVHFAQQEKVPFVAYSGFGIVALARDQYTDKLIRYHEPAPEIVPSFDEVGVNKFILMKDVETIGRIRPLLESQLNGQATVVQALPDMVEILPFGASKGAGLRQLLDDIGIPPEQIFAAGDGENDVEMLQMAGIGVAMGNGMTAAKAAADHVTLTNDEDGLAIAIERFVLGE